MCAIMQEYEEIAKYEKSVAIAKAMLVNGIAADMVSKCTGLSLAQVQKIAASL